MTLTSASGRPLLVAVAAAMAAGAVLWIAAAAHVAYGCAVMDTPYLTLCAPVPSAPDEQQAQLRERIRRNPGDSWAWARLLSAARDDDAAVLRAATALAPNNSSVLRGRAMRALEAGDLSQAVELLVRLLRYRNSPDAARALAMIVTMPEGPALLAPYVKDSQNWLPRVLGEMQAMKLPPESALPLVVEAARQDALLTNTQRTYMKSLKSAGRWLDAHGLWLAMHKHEVPLLYNGTFDRPFLPDGFDWEFNVVTRSKAGVVYEQPAAAKRGLVLALEFTGRRFSAPVLRQYIFAPPGSYKLAGQYMASKLRSEGGLTWSVVCTAGQRRLPVHSSLIQDSGGLWRNTELEFKIPSDCGPVAAIQLEPVHKYETTAGIKGRVELDAFSLTRTGD